jgi:site-specific DNA recombinase
MAANPKRFALAAAPPQVRCAIYTRKSTEEGLDKEFNSLDAQREAGEAYVVSQRHDGWTVVPDRYDDGGFTGANTDRPALQKLMADVEAGKVNCVVVYKVDRFSRALLDFMKMMEVLDRHGVTFVSVTQPFNTTTSPGRLLLNMLFSFAQFEREMISERTRDKMRAARRKGKWIGGNLSLGYDLPPQGGGLIINAAEAQQVRQIFRLYLELGSLIPLIGEIERRGWTLKQWTNREGKQTGGARFTKTTLHNLLTNVIYTGRVNFDGKLCEGEHERIVSDDIWNRVQEQLNRNGRRGGRNVRNKWGALLKGLVRCGSCDCGMIHTYAQKKDKPLYRYYVCINAHQRGWSQCATRSVSAPVLEGAVLEQIRGFAQRPEMLSEVLAHLERDRQEQGNSDPMADPGQVNEALLKFDPLWEQLTTWEQELFVRALVKQVRYDGVTQTVTVGFLTESIKELCNPTVE